MSTTHARPPQSAEAPAPRQHELQRRFTDLVADAERILGVKLPSAALSEPALAEAAPARAV